jgi:hypothetical protein
MFSPPTRKFPKILLSTINLIFVFTTISKIPKILLSTIVSLSLSQHQHLSLIFVLLSRRAGIHTIIFFCDTFISDLKKSEEFSRKSLINLEKSREVSRSLKKSREVMVASCEKFS